MVGSSLSKPVTIYALIDARSGDRRYVGKTTRGERTRLREHIANARLDRPRFRTPVVGWVREILSEGFAPTIEVLEVVPAGVDWAPCERRWIATLPQGQRLNLSDGGDGVSGRPIGGTPQAEKIAAALRTGFWLTCVQCDKVFYRGKHMTALSRRHFCSRECHWIEQRGKRKTRRERGNAKLTAECVRYIRTAKATRKGKHWGANEIAKLFGISKSTVHEVASGKLWPDDGWPA